MFLLKESIMTPKIGDFFSEKAPREMLYMVERLTFVGSMVQRLQIVWIDGLKKGKRAKYCELKIEWFPSFRVQNIHKQKLLEMMLS